MPGGMSKLNSTLAKRGKEFSSNLFSCPGRVGGPFAFLAKAGDFSLGRVGVLSDRFQVNSRVKLWYRGTFRSSCETNSDYVPTVRAFGVPHSRFLFWLGGKFHNLVASLSEPLKAREVWRDYPNH